MIYIFRLLVLPFIIIKRVLSSLLDLGLEIVYFMQTGDSFAQEVASAAYKYSEIEKHALSFNEDEIDELIEALEKHIEDDED